VTRRCDGKLGKQLCGQCERLLPLIRLARSSPPSFPFLSVPPALREGKAPAFVNSFRVCASFPLNVALQGRRSMQRCLLDRLAISRANCHVPILTSRPPSRYDLIWRVRAIPGFEAISIKKLNAPTVAPRGRHAITMVILSYNCDWRVATSSRASVYRAAREGTFVL